MIFKKYSPMGELSDFAAQICESLNKTTESVAAVCDRDTVIAVSGGQRRDFADKRISPEVEQIMDARRIYRMEQDSQGFPVTDGDEKYWMTVGAPILSEGDVLGCVIFAAPKGSSPAGEVEFKLAQTVAAFLGKQMEN